MTHSIINEQHQKVIGYIHFSCFCGLDIYCFGDDQSGDRPAEAINQFRRLLENQPAAIFSTADGISARCPACGIEIELPSAEMVAWFAERESNKVVSKPQRDSAILPGFSTSTPV